MREKGEASARREAPPPSRAVADFLSSEATGGVALVVAAMAAIVLMTLFFFVVALEIKREVVTGELRGEDGQRRALPPAALGALVWFATLSRASTPPSPAWPSAC